MPRRPPRAYDHRIKEQIIRSGDPGLFPELEIPRSTATSWIRRGLGEVVSLDPEDGGFALRDRVAKLEQRVAMLTAVVRLVLALLRVSGFSLEFARIPDAAGKRRLLGAVERARRAMPLSAALRVLRLSSARYHSWVRAEEACTLDDRPSCPRSMPQRLTYGEVEVIGDMVRSIEHRHLSIRGLALHAQRIGKVFAHPATWGKLIRERGWGRPRLRLYPAKPKVGLRTNAPNEAWHIDVTIIRLLDGTKAYVHAVIDNFSRKILAWTEHNERIPHAAFDGQTPDEIYFGRGADVPDELAVARREARKRRVELNRAVACTACLRGAPTPREGIAA
jgi:hypothetical protein